MTPSIVRRIVIAVCVVGIGGMIAGSIADNNGTAITFGLVTAVAALCLIVVNAVTSPPDESVAEDVEARIGRLVAAGADETEVRDLVRQASRLGR